MNKDYKELLTKACNLLAVATDSFPSNDEIVIAIDELMEEIKEVESKDDDKDNWISVEEKPPMHGACLAIDVNGNMSITRGWMHIEDKKGRQFYIDSDLASHYFDENGRGKKPEMRICIYENRMTHWRLLPEPPKEDEDETN